MTWIDTHCHLETFARAGELPNVLERARRAGVGQVITIGTNPEDWPLNATLAAEHRGRIAYTLGLHPCDLGEDEAAWHAAVAALPAYFQRPPSEGPRPVALGEIGLDRFHLPADPAAAAAQFARQEAAFSAQIALARELDCPVVVHSRQAFGECVRVLDAGGVNWRRVVFHCFADGPEEIRALAERGGRASFTGIITYKNAATVRAALVAQGVEKLLLETDAPYLAPMPHRGKPNEPAYLVETARVAAGLLGVDEAVLAARTSATAREFFGLPS
jgi:TatD DNase family protein